MIIHPSAIGDWHRWFGGDAKAGVAAALRKAIRTSVHNGREVWRAPNCKLVVERSGSETRVVGVKRLRGDKGDVSAQRRRRMARERST